MIMTSLTDFLLASNFSKKKNKTKQLSTEGEVNSVEYTEMGSVEVYI